MTSMTLSCPQMLIMLGLTHIHQDHRSGQNPAQTDPPDPQLIEDFENPTRIPIFLPTSFTLFFFFLLISAFPSGISMSNAISCKQCLLSPSFVGANAWLFAQPMSPQKLRLAHDSRRDYARTFPDEREPVWEPGKPKIPKLFEPVEMGGAK